MTILIALVLLLASATGSALAAPSRRVVPPSLPASALVPRLPPSRDLAFPHLAAASDAAAPLPAPELAQIPAGAAEAVAALRGSLHFMRRVGEDLPAEIERLNQARELLRGEAARLNTNGRQLSTDEERAVDAHEPIRLNNGGESAVSHYYAQKVEGLLGAIEVELRARRAAIRYAALKPGLAQGANENAFRVIWRMMAHRGVEELTPVQLDRLLEADELERRQRELRDKREVAERPAANLGYKLARLRSQLQTLERAKTNDWYHTAFGITPEDAEHDIPAIAASIPELEREHERATATSAAALARLDARIAELEARERAIFETVRDGLFDNYNQMRGALLLADRVSGCCAKGCWDCPLTPGLRQNNKEEFFAGSVPYEPLKFKMPANGPTPNLPLYRARALLRSLLPYIDE